MPTNAITLFERDLIAMLKEEYSFYQSLYVLLDKQRDLIQYDKEEHLLDLYVEVERCQRRIQESDSKLSGMRERNPQIFRVAAVHPDVRKLVNSISTLVRKNLALLEENQKYANTKHQRIQKELDQLRNSEKIMRYLAADDPSPQYIDGRE